MVLTGLTPDLRHRFLGQVVGADRVRSLPDHVAFDLGGKLAVEPGKGLPVPVLGDVGKPSHAILSVR